MLVFKVVMDASCSKQPFSYLIQTLQAQRLIYCCVCLCLVACSHTAFLGEEQPSTTSTAILSWDIELQVQLRENDPGRDEGPRLLLIDTSLAALWGCNAVTTTAAARLSASSECFKYFSEHHRDRCLQVIQRARVKQGTHIASCLHGRDSTSAIAAHGFCISLAYFVL
jgi:hypothetical protein